MEAPTSPLPHRFAQEAPATLAVLDKTAPAEVGQGDYIRADYDEDLLTMMCDAYVEADARRRDTLLEPPSADQTPVMTFQRAGEWIGE
jgi:hypothetical protein